MSAREERTRRAWFARKGAQPGPVEETVDPWAPRADDPPLELMRVGQAVALVAAPVAAPVVPEPVVVAPPPLPVAPRQPVAAAPAAAPAPATAPTTRTSRRFPVLEIVLGVVVLGLVAALATGHQVAAIILGLMIVLAVGLWVVAFHPMLIFFGMALMLGLAPGIQVPVVNYSFAFVLSAGMWVALAFMPEARHRAGWPVVLTGVLILVSAFSVIGNPITSASLTDFARWAIAAAAVYPLYVLPTDKLATVGRWFVAGCTGAAIFGIAFILADPHGERLFTISFLGYQPGLLNSRYVLGPNGPIIRLTGTYVDPNLGGLIMTAGLILALALLKGRRRILCSGVLIMAIALTLSRADAGSVAMAGILLVLFGGINAKLRGRLIALGVVAFAGLISLPAVRSRLLNSFGSKDHGSSARVEAIKAMPHQLQGHWFFGRGFGAPEFIDQNATAATNFVANAPLLSVYRAGVIVGIAFLALTLTATVVAWRLLRRHDFERAALGAGYLGLMLVAFQLDIPIITLTPAVLVLSLLLAFLGNPEAVSPEGEPRARRRRIPERALPEAPQRLEVLSNA